MEKLNRKKLYEILNQKKQTYTDENTQIVLKSDLKYEVNNNGKSYQFIFDKTGISDNSDSVNLEINDMKTSEYAKYSIPLNEYINISEGQAMITFAEKYIEIFTKDSNKETLK